MAEEPSPLSPSSENSPSSHKRRITQNPSLNLTLEFNSSTLELGTSQTQQQTQSFPQQSPKKPKFSSLNHSPPPPPPTTTADECYIIHDDDDENTQNLGKKQLIIDDCEVEFQEKGSENDQLGGENFNFGDKIEVSELGLAKNYVGADQKEVIEDLNDEKLILGDKIEDSDMGFVRNDVGFDEKEVIDENLGVLGDNTAEFGCDKKDENAENFDGVLPKMAKTEDSASSKLMIEVMDGTALVDVSLVEEKRNRRRGNNHNRNHNHKKSNPRNNASVSNEGKKKCVYSRKELEVLRYMNVKGQRKFWQEIYNGFSATVKKEYDEVGSFRHHKHGGPSSDNHNNGGMRNFTNGGIMGTCSIVPNYNNRGILGVAAARGRCNNPNNFVYKRKRIANCNA